MRLIAWNLNHRAKARSIPPWITDAIEARHPDLVVLCEYVEGPDHSNFIEALTAGAGLGNVLCSERVVGQNQVLVASRLRMTRGAIKAPPLHPSVSPNFLHVVLPDFRLDCFAVRIPIGGDFDHLKRTLWQWLLSTAEANLRNAALLAGDLNTDPNDPYGQCGDCLGALVEIGWKSSSPAAGASFGGPNGRRRIDHMYVTPSLKVRSAMYDWAWMNGDPGQVKVGLPDHAMIVADFDVQY